jgi:PPM family protein phosphatase
MDDQAVNSELGLEYAALSDIGLRRASNQDSLTVALAGSAEELRARGHLFLVADGMGAHAAGELASKLSADTIPHAYRKLPDCSPPEALQKALEEANARIHDRGQANPEFRGMGTTTSVLVLLPGEAIVAHVGDSRVYRLRGNRLEQLSFDHSLVWEMMASGRIAENEVPSYVPKNIITRSLGPAPQVEVDLEGPFPLALGDSFLLCSDGLSGPVKDQELGTILGCLPPQEAVRALVDLANLRGGPDNITVVVARVTGPPLDQRSGGAPIAASERPRGSSILPWLWAGFGVFLAATFALAAMRRTVEAVASGIIAAAAAAAIAVKKYRRAVAPSARPETQRLGRGPHTSFICTADGAFVDQLAKLSEQLRTAATDEDWYVDWSRFNALDSQAHAAAEERNYPKAVREYCHAIGFIMEELRSQKSKEKKE